MVTHPIGRVSGPRLARLLEGWHGAGRPSSAALAGAIRLLVLDGRLPPGTALPAEREVAAALRVSRTLVATAWDALRADGLVRTRRGAGTWTALPGPGRAQDNPGDQPLDLARAASAALPAVAHAVDAVRGALTAELAGHGYHDYGIDLLRERLADRYTARGLPTTADQILVTNGAHHALALVLRTFTGPGDRVLVDQPTYPNAIDAITAAHAIPVPVPLLDDGWDFDGVAAALRQSGPRLAYLIVDFHNPTGLLLDADGRGRLAALAARARTPLVVDETIAELDLRAAPEPVAPLSGPGTVITIGSASKSHWGGLRLGWVRADADVVRRLASARHAFDLGSPVFEQLVLAELYADPVPAIAERRADLARRRDVLVAAVREHLPDWSFRVPDGGLGLWCALPGPMASRLALAARAVGVRVAPGSRFSPHGGLERWLRLPYTLPEPLLVEAVRRLSPAAASVTGSLGSDGTDGLIPVA
ncbi:PLP-dependent aminotransferase family protein [Actinokineospora soli]|uniref:PLP-dependent aminotransferase family protein n=1 Tax=Actinokineospora soli TaxID=1048753 RepID=A0ABW2TW43_9PSEU